MSLRLTLFRRALRRLAIMAVCLQPAAAIAAGPTQSELDASASATDSWLMTNKSYEGTRFVGLDQINPSNVRDLQQVCMLDTQVDAPAQSVPVLYQGVLYLSAGQVTLAIDGRTCKEIWRSEWTLKDKALSKPNRGVAIKDGQIVRGTSDGFLIALSMKDGKLLWERQITSASQNHYLSMPAMIVDDTIIYGTAGADFGARGWIGGFKLASGEERWRFNALPEPDDPEAGSWGTPEALTNGGGSFWTPVAVDRKARLVYAPVGNPAPDFFGGVRPGANLYTNSLVALDVKSGRAAWARQFVPHDIRDWDLSQTSPLLDIDFGGSARKLVAVSGKDGRLRLVDREKHDTLYDVALAPQKNVDQPPTVEGLKICPGLLGGQEWSSTAYDPVNRLLLSPMVNWCGTAHRSAEAPVHKDGEHYYGGKVVQDPVETARGVLSAVDVETGKVRWKFEADAPMLANVTVTSGGIVFAGEMDGTLLGLDARTGEALLKKQIDGSLGGGIITYRQDDKQFVAVVSGSVSAFFGGKGTVKLTVLGLPRF